MSGLEVVATGPLATVQDLGRPGVADLGVSPSGATDLGAFRLGNRLVGNAETCAAIEVTFGGLAVRARAAVVVALTGAPAPATVDGAPAPLYAPFLLPAGTTLRLGLPAYGMRSYLAVRGGVDVPAVLGSRSTDVLSGIGPAVLAPGTVLPLGPGTGEAVGTDAAGSGPTSADEIEVRAVPGPRDDWFTPEALRLLAGRRWEVSADNNRIGIRLTGPELTRSVSGELPSEGIVRGAVQVPASGQPLVFLADHPTTGGYPVIAVVLPADVDRLAQLRPGQGLRIRLVPVRRTAG